MIDLIRFSCRSDRRRVVSSRITTETGFIRQWVAILVVVEAVEQGRNLRNNEMIPDDSDEGTTEERKKGQLRIRRSRRPDIRVSMCED